MVEMGREGRSASESGGVMLSMDWGLVITDLSGLVLEESRSMVVSEGGGAGEGEPVGVASEKVE